MHKLKFSVVLLLITLPLLLASCTPGGEDTSKSLLIAGAYKNAGTVNETYSDALGYYYNTITIPEQDGGKNVRFEYNLDLGADYKDVYFVFTNTSTSSRSSYPLLDSTSMSVTQGATPESVDAARAAALSTGSTAQRGKPEISEFNRKPWDILNKINPVNVLLNSIALPEPRQDTVTDIHTFKIDAHTTVDATCQYVSPAIPTAFGDTKKLNIWVADDMWGAPYVTLDMVTALANKFLKSGLDNDIYDWVTNIYGEEWGSLFGSSLSDTDQSMLIGPNTDITILLFDIDADRSPDGGVVGYFWAKDNFKESVVHYSNERIMFYIDAVMLANADGGAWAITDKWPSIVISVLSHEFKHMIHFYQKTIMRSGGSGSETWLDEMCAMATEDLVADKVQVDGPRGVAYDNYTAGSTGNTNGRLPLYNLYDDYSVTNWYSGNLVLVSYSLNYALGAYLSRNYGGAEFFRNVVQNEFTDEAAIEFALHKITGHETDTFSQVLQKWAVSNLLSDKTDTIDGYMYNNVTPLTTFDSTVSGKHYTLGSINLYNYLYPYSTEPQTGPYIYTNMRTGMMPPASNIYYKAGEGITGAHNWTIRLKSGVRMSVVVK
jgi:hypothetical protein